MDRAALQAEEGLRRSWLEPLLDKTLDGAERILAQCDRFDIRLLTYAEPAYPERLRNIADPPALLYYQGRLPDFDHEAAIAVVGSRRCSAYGLLHAKQFSRLIAASGGLVMSGRCTRHRYHGAAERDGPGRSRSFVCWPAGSTSPIHRKTASCLRRSRREAAS